MTHGNIDARDLESIANHPLQKAARAVVEVLPSQTGFIIISCPFGDGHGRGDYVSNMSRESAIAILKTVLFRWGVNEEWMKHAK